ncbi:TcmI family type II polyketide cyclase [Actinokineospora sp. G85]|uniref:TcmI family type II polyketide cyclase n=1 Tax=Actinokineospora sp. G85 TaxID=3406626 RepID=UPI003C74D054
MHTTVSVGRMDPAAATAIARVYAESESAGPPVPGLKRRQLYRYYDVFVEIQDFSGENAAEAAEEATRHPAILRVRENLAPHVTAFDPAATGDRATTFYHWEGAPPIDKETGLHSTVIVNRVRDAVIPEVARLFGELDETDFPYRMGTRRRQLFTYHGVYFHIQDFEARDGNAVIDQAWKEADPRFVKICADLDPLVHKYAPERWRSTDDQIAVRFHHWEVRA